MHNVPLPIYFLYFKNSQLLNRCQMDPCVCDVFDPESALKLNPKVVTLTPVTPCIEISIRYKHNQRKYSLVTSEYVPVQILWLSPLIKNPDSINGRC